MHDIEPYYRWREKYVASEDDKSPFYGREYDEFTFSKKIYNYFIHPQWDEFGSSTLYIKILFVDYEERFAILELIGEWNDAIGNDIMFLKRELADIMIQTGIFKFILACENVLNFHGSDDCYYEEWFQDIMEFGGYIALINLQPQVEQEMYETQLHNYLNFGDHFNDINWRALSPQNFFKTIESKKHQQIRSLG